MGAYFPTVFLLLQWVSAMNDSVGNKMLALSAKLQELPLFIVSSLSSLLRFVTPEHLVIFSPLAPFVPQAARRKTVQK